MVGAKVTAASARIQHGGPLFVAGAPRSGTSLAYRALSLHPEAAYISNWLARWPGRRTLSLLNRIPRSMPGLRSKYWFGEESNAYRYGRRRPLAERLFPAPVEGGPVFNAFGVRDGASTLEPDRVRGLRRALAGPVRYGGGTTLISKRIANNRSLALLAEAFPEARFVSMMRDGRAVAYSLSRVNWWEESDLWWFGGTPQLWQEQGKDPWEACARTWVEEVRAIDAGLTGIDPGRVLRVTYEAMVADPLAELGRISRFGGLPESDAWTAALRRLSFPNRNEAWRSNVAPQVVTQIEQIQAEELRRYGYV